MLGCTCMYLCSDCWMFVDCLFTVPTFIVLPSNVTTLITSTLQHMQCEADGYPIPTLTWQHRSMSSRSWQTVKRSSGRHHYALAGRKLEFRKLIASDIGFYRCRADNALDIAFSEPAYLDLNGEA